MSFKYEPSSEPHHISAEQLFLNWKLYRSVQVNPAVRPLLTPHLNDLDAKIMPGMVRAYLSIYLFI